jgi:ubiquinone/menaquinone biosynthesis C-methylase UbiE
VIRNALDIVEASLAPLAGKHIVDIGCGDGVLARRLSDLGAKVAAIDPNPDAVAAARVNAPDAVCLAGVAEHLPFAAAQFDGALFINALHHVPVAAMSAALAEAARVLRRDGVLVIVELLPEGSFFEALRLVEDETDVRNAARRAIDGAVATGVFGRSETLTYVRREGYRTVDAFLDRVVAVDPRRRAMVENDRANIVAAVDAAAARADTGELMFEQPIRADILRMPA